MFLIAKILFFFFASLSKTVLFYLFFLNFLYCGGFCHTLKWNSYSRNILREWLVLIFIAKLAMTAAKCFPFKLNLKSFICIFSNSGILLRKCQGGWHKGGGGVREDVSSLVLLNWFKYFKLVISDLSLGDLFIYCFVLFCFFLQITAAMNLQFKNLWRSKIWNSN